MLGALQRVAFTLFGRLPRRVRVRLVRTIAPSFTVGSICVIERTDGRIALIQQRYRKRWGLPGGLLARGESPDAAARREVREEIGIEVDLVGEPVVVVESDVRRVDVVFRAVAVAEDPGLDDLVPTSAEIRSVGWFAPDRLPELQPETGTALDALERARRAQG